VRRVLYVLVLVVVNTAAAGQEFNYGLWEKSEVVKKRQVPVNGERKKIPAGRNNKDPEFSWKIFLPKDLPKPFVKLLENPTSENAKKYWKAYEEFVDRLSRAEREVRLLQLEYARKVSSKYRLYYFFSPSCSSCLAYSPPLFRELVKEGFDIPTVAFVVKNSPEDFERGRVFASALGVTSVRQATPELVSQLGVRALPTAVILRGDEVVAKYSGPSVLEVVTYLKEKRDEAISNSVSTELSR